MLRSIEWQLQRFTIISETFKRLTIAMPKQLIKISMERDSLQQKWGITIQGGADLALTAKIASVKVR